MTALYYFMKPVKNEKLFAVFDRAVENPGQKEKPLVSETENSTMRVNFSNIIMVSA